MKLKNIFYRFKKRLLCDHEWSDRKLVDSYIGIYYPGCAYARSLDGLYQGTL